MITRLGDMYSCSGYCGKAVSYLQQYFIHHHLFSFYLSVFVQNVSEEAVGVWESLRASALPDADHPVLLRMQHTSLKQNIQIYLSTTDRHSITSLVAARSCCPNEIRASSRAKGRTCLPMGSGLVTVVLKKPSHSSLPYRPAQWLWRLPVCGRHQGIKVLNCLSAGSHGFPARKQRISNVVKLGMNLLRLKWKACIPPAQVQTPLSAPVLLRPFFLSKCV